MMEETLRLADYGDVSVVTALTRAAYAKWVPVIGREPLPMRADYAEAIRSHRIDLLTVGDEVAALVETMQRAGDVLIVNVAVAPAFQKRGYGRRMIAHAEGLATAANLPLVRLYTNSRFDANLRLYGSLGYEVEREEIFDWGVVIHMLKRVTVPT